MLIQNLIVRKFLFSLYSIWAKKLNQSRRRTLLFSSILLFVFAHMNRCTVSNLIKPETLTISTLTR